MENIPLHNIVFDQNKTASNRGAMPMNVKKPPAFMKNFNPNGTKPSSRSSNRNSRGENRSSGLFSNELLT